MKCCAVFLVLVFFITVWAQPNDVPLYLEITYPTQSDTVNADKVRISGHTFPDAILRINSKKVDLFPQGSFATRVNLLEGMNQIIVLAQRGEERVQDILFIYRPEELKSLPLEPTTIEKNYLEPQDDIWLMNGDYLSVKFKGSPGGQAQFTVEKLGKNAPMLELPVEQTNGIAGIYHGIIKLDDLPDDRALNIEFQLIGTDQKKKQRSAPGRLHILSNQMPLIGRTIAPTFLHSSPTGYFPISRIPDSVKVHVVGRQGARYKLDLINRKGYIETRDVVLLPGGTPLPRTTVGAPQIEQDKDWLHFILPVGERVPFQTNVETDPLQVKLTLWGGQQASHWITFPNTAIDLVNLTFDQADEFVFHILAELKQSRCWGYKVFYKDGALHLSIRRQPMINPNNPVQNLIFAIDPGHGGEELGATSPLGIYEKDVNRLWADELTELLRKNGAQVINTREADDTVSLQKRVQRAEAANAHFFISLHNNATSAYGNPLSAQGTSVFFSLPQNKELSWAIYPHLVKLGLAPYGRVYNSYFVTNATGFLVALVEGGFLTNPYEELKLADSDFIQKMAWAVFYGLLDFLKSQTEG